MAMEGKGKGDRPGRRASDAREALRALDWESWFRGPLCALESSLSAYGAFREQEVRLLAHLVCGIAFSLAGLAAMAGFFLAGLGPEHPSWGLAAGLALGLRVAGFVAAAWGGIGLLDNYADREEFLRMARSWHARNLLDANKLREAAGKGTELSEALREVWEIGEASRPGRELRISPWSLRFRASPPSGDR